MPLRLVKFLKIGAMKAMLYLMVQRKFCSYFLDISADLVKIRHRKYPQNLVSVCEFSLPI
jgi:hypothetical protein